MNRPELPHSDTLPWYRHFWLWVLISLPTAAVIAGLATVYIAVEGADDLVVVDYYKDGLAINRVLEKEQMAKDKGFSATLELHKGRVIVRLLGADQPAQLELRLTHPLEANHDLNVVLNPVSPGVFQATLPSAVYPRWYWTILPMPAGDWQLKGVLRSADFGDASKR